MVEFLSLSWHGRKKKGAAAGGRSSSTHGTTSRTSGDRSVGAGSNASAQRRSSTSASSSSSLKAANAAAANKAAQWHQELKAFEAQRRQKFKSFLESAKLRLESYANLLQEGIDETAKTHRFVMGMAKAHHILADTAFRNEDGEDGYAAVGDVDTDVTISVGMRQRKAASATATADGQDGADANEKGLLSGLVESNKLVYGSIKENAEKMESVDAKLQKVLAELRDQQTDLDQKSNMIVSLLENADDEVCKTWDTYQQIATARQKDKPTAGRRIGDFILGGSFHGRTSSRLKDSNHNKKKQDRRGSTTTSTLEQAPIGNADQWLAELNYRMALDASEETITKSMALISEIVSSTRSYECRRRINLREYLVVFVQTTQTIYQESERAQTVAVVDWIEKEASEEDIEKEVEEHIREQQETQEEKPWGDLDVAGQEEGVSADGETGLDSVRPAAADRFSVATFYESLYAASPMQSDYLTRAAVVENIKGTDGAGRVSLVVVTCDYLLHVFEFDRETTVSLQESPEAAFAQLLQASESNEDVNMSASDKLRARKRALEPKRTLDLSQTEVTESKDMEHAVDIKSRQDATLVYAPLRLLAASTEEQTELLNALLSARLTL